MKKRNVSAVTKLQTILIIVALIVAGAGTGLWYYSSQPKAERIVKILGQSYTTGEFYKKYAEDWGKANGITVQWDELPVSTFGPKVTLILQSNSTEYDLIQSDQASTRRWAPQGYLTDITDDFISMKDQIVGYDSGLNRADNRLYGITVGLATGCGFYRTDLLAQAGIEVPKNFSEVLSAMQLLTVKNQDGTVKRYGVVSSGLYYFVWWSYYLLSSGGEFMNEQTGAPLFNSSAGLEALDFLKETYKSPYANPASITYTEADAAGEFYNDRAAIVWSMPQWQYSKDGWDASGSVIAGKWAPMLIPGNKIRSASHLFECHFELAKAAQHKADAIKLMKEVFLNYDTQKNISAVEGMVPSLKSLLSDAELLTKNKSLRTVAEQVTYPDAYRYQDQYYWAEYDACNPIIENFLAGQISGQETLNQMVTAFKAARVG